MENCDGGRYAVAFIPGGAIVLVVVLGFLFYKGGNRGAGGRNGHAAQNVQLH
jgi:hypothetical protein